MKKDVFVGTAVAVNESTGQVVEVSVAREFVGVIADGHTQWAKGRKKAFLAGAELAFVANEEGVLQLPNFERLKVLEWGQESTQ